MVEKLKPRAPDSGLGARTAQLMPSLLVIAVLLAAIQPGLTAAASGNLAIEDVVFIVMSQPNPFHVQRADVLHGHINKQLKVLNIPQKKLTFVYLHKEWPDVGSWTIKPILSSIGVKYSKKKAVFFFEDETRLDVKELIKKLGDYDFSQELFLGHALRDKEATIIHHFAFHEKPGSFLYPDFAAGFILSLPLVNSLAKKIAEKDRQLDFSIDAKHELAMFIWNEDQGLRLTDVSFLCTGPPREGCASYFPTKIPACGEPLAEDDLFVAIKTYHNFHKDRVPIVQKTWGLDAKHKEFYSDQEDSSIPTVYLGVNNTESGHCAKLMAILTRFHETTSLSRHDWLLVADDDTLISIPRLRQVLACYSPAEPVALGERYGYGVSAGYGYDYITGGGGMVLNHLSVSQLIASGRCRCGADDAPDDMTLGMCLKQMGIPVTHSPLFHQARPDDYSDGYLSHQIPVSFHKHWMIDPITVYNQWLLPEVSHDEL